MSPQDQLSTISREVSRYGSANGHAYFDTEDDAIAFSQILTERYPAKGYGTYCSVPQILESANGHDTYFVSWFVGSAD